MAAGNSKLGGRRSEVGIVRKCRHQNMFLGSGGLLSDYFWKWSVLPALAGLSPGRETLQSPGCEPVFVRVVVRKRSSVPYQRQLFVMTQPRTCLQLSADHS